MEPYKPPRYRGELVRPLDRTCGLVDRNSDLGISFELLTPSS